MSKVSDEIERLLGESKTFIAAAEIGTEPEQIVADCLTATNLLIMAELHSKKLTPSLLSRGVRAMIEGEQARITKVLLKAISGD